MDNLPPMEALVAIVSAARLGSLTSAAEELGVTHGAVSRRLKAAEEWLGAEIFERHGRGVRLTADGALLARRMERLMGALSNTANDIKSRRSGGVVKVNVLPSFARLWLIPRIPLIEDGPPELTIRLTTAYGIAQLDGRESDIAVRSGYGDWPGVQAHKLFGDRLVPVASPALAARIAAERGSLFSYPLIHDGDSGMWRQWSRDSGQDYAPTGGERRFGDYDLVLGAARAGLGIALGRMPLAADAVKEMGLVRIPAPAVEIGRGHWVVTRSAEDRPAVLAAVERLLALSASLRS